MRGALCHNLLEGSPWRAQRARVVTPRERDASESLASCRRGLCSPGAAVRGPLAAPFLPLARPPPGRSSPALCRWRFSTAMPGPRRAGRETGILYRVLLPLSPRPTRLVGLVLLALTIAAVTPASASANEQLRAGAASSWSWPIAAPRAVLRPFIAPLTAYSAGHRGIDLATQSSTTVYAPADGVIHFSGKVVDRPVLSIEHAGSLLSSFEPVSSTLHVGESVHRGDPVGVVAAGSGHCASSCLHFGVRLHGQYLSPLNFLGGIPLPVLLPTRTLH
jgi:hypothetical protein